MTSVWGSEGSRDRGQDCTPCPAVSNPSDVVPGLHLEGQKRCFEWKGWYQQAVGTGSVTRESSAVRERPAASTFSSCPVLSKTCPVESEEGMLLSGGLGTAAA